MLTASGQPTGNTDNITIPRADALKVLAAADSAKIHKLTIVALAKDTALLAQRTRELQQARDAYKRADSLGQVNLLLAGKQLSVQADQLKISQSYIDGLNKLYKRQKRKTVITALAGIITTVAAVIFIK